MRLLFLVLALLVPMAAAAAGLPVAKKTVTFKDKRTDITVDYPQTGNKAIDAALADYARRSVAWFKASNTDDDPTMPTYMLQTTYEVARNDGRMFAVLFTLYTDMGGAHPNSDYQTFNFLLPDGAQVYLPEIVDGARGLKRISDLAAADLLKRIGHGPDALSDKDTIAMGTGPAADNFKGFVWQPGELHIYFPPYQVAAYAAGPQESRIPLGALKDVIRADWRAPAASFDCARARTPVEHAICADAGLARLDRRTAEAYQTALHNAYEASEKDKIRQDQRAWLAKRDAACAAAAPCLAKFYRDRIAVLAPNQL